MRELYERYLAAIVFTIAGTDREPCPDGTTEEILAMALGCCSGKNGRVTTFENFEKSIKEATKQLNPTNKE